MDTRQHFSHAHAQALRQDLLARLKGEQNDLLPYEALENVLRTYQQIPRRGPEMIPLAKIVGSVGRYHDFTRDFLPRNAAMAERWARVEEKVSAAGWIPPIEVYKIGNVYFVADGNHRVSVARANGLEEIDAYVTEILVDPQLEPGDTLDQAIIKAERARFLSETRLDRHHPNPDIYFTKPGGYAHLLNHIQVHRRFMTQGGAEAETVTLEAAAADWYQNSYLPIIAAIREQHLLERFPGRTAADLYVWVWKTIVQLYQIYGEKVDANEAAALLGLKPPTTSRQAIGGLLRRIANPAKLNTTPTDDIPDWVMQELEREPPPVDPSWGESRAVE